MAFHGKFAALCAAGLLLGGAPVRIVAQTPAPDGSTQTTPAPAPAPQAPDATEPGTPHRGQIIIQSHGEPPSGDPEAAPIDPQQPHAPGETASADISDAERAALIVTSYDLDARLDLGRAGLSMRARISVRNDGAAPLRQLPLQISSSLRWESATLIEGSHRTALTLAQHRLDTDADHTGAATEAVLPLPAPLAPGASAELDLFYSGTVRQDAGRLARLGARAAQGQNTDWDAIGPTWTGLRGFGDVLWYPVASPQLFLAEGNTLFTAVGRMRLRDEAVPAHLRISVLYGGEPPAAVYFCGRRAALKALADDPDAAISAGSGVATAEFPMEALGFRLPSLFVISEPETLLGSPGAAGSAFSSSSTTGTSSSSKSAAATSSSDAAAADQTAGGLGESSLVALVSRDPGTASGLEAAAENAGSLLADWLGPRPLSALTLLDHSGQPFQDGPLLVAPAATLQTSPETPALVYSLSHAWVQTGQPWMDEGLAQFFALLWEERDHGREDALAQLNELMQPVGLLEPDLTSAHDTKPGEPIVAASDDLFYRRKAAAVWWMLREVAGEKSLRAALAAWRTQPESQAPATEQAVAFEHLLEKLSGKSLDWFFADWVLRDRGLPDLSIADVQAGQTPAGAGHNTGWLVAVTVRNDGGAIADVPLVVRSGQFIATERMRIPGFGQVTERVLVESPPTEVVVNDGSTPELRAATHSRTLTVQAH